MNKLIRILTAFAALGAICLGLFGPRGGASAQTTQAYGFVINENGDSISIVEPGSGKILATHSYGGSSGANFKMASVESSPYLCSMSSDSQGVTYLQMAYGMASDGVLSRPHLGAYDQATRRLYVGNKGSNLAVFDMTNVMAPKLVANLTPGGPGEIHRVVIADGLVWMAHLGDSAIYAYDPADLTAPKVVLKKDKGFDTPHGMTLRPGTHELWITNKPAKGKGFLLRVDTVTRSVIGGPLLTTSKDADQPNNTAFTDDGKWAYVANMGPKATEVTVVDAEKFVVIKQIEQDATVGVSPHAIVFEPVSRRMFAVNVTSGTLSAINTSTNTVLGYFSVGAESHGVSVGPDGMIYALSKRDNTMIVMNPQTFEITSRVKDSGLLGPHQIVFTAEYQPAPPTATPVQPSPTAQAPALTTPSIAPTEIATVQPAPILQQPTAVPEVEVPVGMPRTGGGLPDLFLPVVSALLLVVVGGLIVMPRRKKT